MALPLDANPDPRPRPRPGAQTPAPAPGGAPPGVVVQPLPPTGGIPSDFPLPQSGAGGAEVNPGGIGAPGGMEPLPLPLPPPPPPPPAPIPPSVADGTPQRVGVPGTFGAPGSPAALSLNPGASRLFSRPPAGAPSAIQRFGPGTPFAGSGALGAGAGAGLREGGGPVDEETLRMLLALLQSGGLGAGGG